MFSALPGGGLADRFPGKPHWVWLLVSALWLNGCADGPFPREISDLARQQPAFASLKANPDDFKNVTVILGGTIIQTTNFKDHSDVEILQKPLDGNYQPQAMDTADGRFLARCREFLDPEIYKAGRDISVAGTVEGKVERPVGEVSYAYPLINCQKLQLWYGRRDDYDYPAPYWYGPYGGYGGYGWYGWPPPVLVRPGRLR